MQKIQKPTKKSMIIVIAVAVLLLAGTFAWIQKDSKKAIDSFDACVAAGNQIMTSYPEQCAADGKTFTNPRQ